MEEPEDARTQLVCLNSELQQHRGGGGGRQSSLQAYFGGREAGGEAGAASTLYDLKGSSGPTHPAVLRWKSRLS